jgi:hypothetical protein
MRSTIFVRPNLKLFLLAAVLLAAAHNLIWSGRSEASVLIVSGRTAGDRALLQQELDQLLVEVRERPRSESLFRIGTCYERLGQFREASRFFRKATLVAEQED